MLELPDLTGLPPFAQGVVYTIIGITLAVSFLVPRLGFLKGNKDKPQGTGEPGFAAVVVDPTALNAHSQQVQHLSVSVDQLTVTLKEVVRETDLMREEMRVTREVGRSRAARS